MLEISFDFTLMKLFSASLYSNPKSSILTSTVGVSELIPKYPGLKIVFVPKPPLQLLVINDAGLASSITGSSVTRAGGGGGGAWAGTNHAGSAGGSGGGGRGNGNGNAGTDGTANTGSGGGGGGYGHNGGDGGSGIVIIRYKFQ